MIRSCSCTDLQELPSFFRYALVDFRRRDHKCFPARFHILPDELETDVIVSPL